MIAFYIVHQEISARRRGNRPHAWRPRSHQHSGDVLFHNRQVHLLRENGSCFARRSKVTLFDDSQTPPKLIREDYPLKQLAKLKARLPEMWIDERGNIITRDGETIMQGPTNP